MRSWIEKQLWLVAGANRLRGNPRQLTISGGQTYNLSILRLFPSYPETISGIQHLRPS